MESNFEERADSEEVDDQRPTSKASGCIGRGIKQTVRQHWSSRQYAVEEDRKPSTNTSSPDPPSSASLQDCVWRGTMSTIHDHDAKAQDGRSVCNGNLKLVHNGDPKRVLALWRNATDKSRLGDLIVYDNFDNENEIDDKMIQRLIVSCLGVVLFERASGRGWTGGFGKSRSKGG